MLSLFKKTAPSPWVDQSRLDRSWIQFCRQQAGRPVRDNEDCFRFEDLKRHWSEMGPMLHQALVNEEFEVRPGRAVLAQLDKPRTLIQFPWVERFVYFHVASCLFEDFESKWSPQLWSFRPGLGQGAALKSVSLYLQKTLGARHFVLRRDIQSYGESMGRDILLQTIDERRPLNRWEQNILKKLFSYSFFDTGGHVVPSTRGLPTGSFLQVVCENIYLMPLDETLSSIDGLYWARFGDDILVIGDPDEINHQGITEQLDECIARLALVWKKEKTENCAVSAGGGSFKELKGSQSFGYLGRQVFYNGDLYLNADKRRAFLNELDQFLNCLKWNSQSHVDESKNLKRIARALYRAWTDPKGLMFQSLGSVTHDISDAGVRELDRLVNERVVAAVTGDRFRKGQFRKLKGQSPREIGLPSLLHLKRKKLLEVS